MNARYYVPSLGRFASADTIVPDSTNPQAFNRYSYVHNNPLIYTDPTGHCVDGVTTWFCIAAAAVAISKVIDYGLTAYDSWQAGQTLADSNASGMDKAIAGLNVSLAVILEAAEPDDLLPVGLPLDDLGRRAIINGAQEAVEQGGGKALEGFLRNQLGDHADTVFAKLDDLLGLNDIRFPEGPGQIQHIFRNSSGHLAEDTLANRQLLLDTVSSKNFITTNQFGNDVYARLLDDGTETWVEVRNGLIQNGGVNQIPRQIK